MKSQYCLVILAFTLISSLPDLKAQSAEYDSSLITRELEINISCDKIKFIQGEPINVLIKIINNSKDSTQIYLNHYLYDQEKDSTFKHSFQKGAYIFPSDKYYLIVDPATEWMFLGSIDLSTNSLKQGTYNYYVSTTFHNKKYSSNKVKIQVSPVPDSLMQAYNDLSYILNHPIPIDTAEALLEKYKGSFYEERYFDNIFGYPIYYYAIQNNHEFRTYRDKAINLSREFILKYPNSTNAYRLFQKIMYNYEVNNSLIIEILTSLKNNRPDCKLLEVLRNQPYYLNREIKYLLN